MLWTAVTVDRHRGELTGTDSIDAQFEPAGRIDPGSAREIDPVVPVADHGGDRQIR